MIRIALKLLLSCIIYSAISYLLLPSNSPSEFTSPEAAVQDIVIFSGMFLGLATLPMIVATTRAYLGRGKGREYQLRQMNGGLLFTWLVALTFLYFGWYGEQAVNAHLERTSSHQTSSPMNDVQSRHKIDNMINDLVISRNASLPAPADQYFDLMQVSYEHSTFQSHYRLRGDSGETLDELDWPAFRVIQRAGLLQKYCFDESMEMFRKLSLTVEQKYYLAPKSSDFSIRVEKADCSRAFPDRQRRERHLPESREQLR